MSKTLNNQYYEDSDHLTQNLCGKLGRCVNFSTKLQSKNTFSDICLLEASHLVSPIC